MLEKFQECDNPEKLQEISKQVFKEMLTMARQFANRHEKMMEALWNEYDKNSTSTRAQPLCDLICAEDGHLQIDELMKMQLHALQQNVEQVDDNVVTAIDSFFEALEVSTVLSAALTGS